MAKPRFDYLVTNRVHIAGDRFEDRVATHLTYLRSPAGAGAFAVVLYDEWQLTLKEDIVATAVSGVGQALLFIHGYGVDFDKARALFGDFLHNFFVLGGYPGPVIEFDWPSNGVIGLTDLFPKTFQEAKQRATETGAMFGQLAQVLADIRKIKLLSSMNLVAVCHSMGNYAMQQGAPHLPTGAASLLKKILLVAPMLATDSFNPNGQSKTPGKAILDASAGPVTAYFTRYDDVLPFAALPLSELDAYPELGVTGPLYTPTPTQPLYPGFSAVDCTSVVNPTAAKAAGAPGVHEAYFYIPQMVQQLVQAIKATSEE